MRAEARWEKLSKAYRFRRVCEARKKCRGSYLSVYFLPSPDGVTRAGISVGKRIGNAVMRNRAKRLIREVLRRKRSCVTLPVWIVCVAKKEIVEAGYPCVEADFLKLLDKSGVCQ